MNEDKVKVWLARDKDGSLWLYPSVPYREDDIWGCEWSSSKIDSHKFPSVKWEDDEPTEAYITLANEPQENKEIDWGQRFYEVIRDNLFHCPITDNLDEYKSYLTVAVKRAEILINELKKQSDEL